MIFLFCGVLVDDPVIDLKVPNILYMCSTLPEMSFYLVAIALMSSIHKDASLVFSLIEIVRGGIAISNNLIGRYLQGIHENLSFSSFIIL